MFYTKYILLGCYKIVLHFILSGSAKANVQVYHFKLDSFSVMKGVHCPNEGRCLKLKNQPRFCPAWLKFVHDFILSVNSHRREEVDVVSLNGRRQKEHQNEKKCRHLGWLISRAFLLPWVSLKINSNYLIFLFVWTHCKEKYFFSFYLNQFEQNLWRKKQHVLNKYFKHLQYL